MEQISLCIWLICLALTKVWAYDHYNVLSPKDFELFKGSSVPCAVHFVTRSPDKIKADWRMNEFITNYLNAGQYLEDFDVKFATVNCIDDPVKEFCSRDVARNTLFVFKHGNTLAELPMDTLYNVDSIISNLLHLVLLREVPFIQQPADLAAMQQRLKGRKDILFAKLIAVGSPEHRAFMEGAFAYSHLYQFVMTTSVATNMLGPELDDEWKEARDRVWLFECKRATVAEPCQRSFYRGKLLVPDLALYLKTLDVLPFVEYTSSSTTIFYQKLGIPTAYLYTNTAQYGNHKEIVQSVAQTFRGNLGFVLVNSDQTPGNVVAGSEGCEAPCLMLQRAPQESLLQMKGAPTAENIRTFIEENMYVQDGTMQDQEKEEENPIPVQELQDDEVQYAVYRDTRVLDMPHVAKLTDKTFSEFVADARLVVVLFTVHWDPRCKAFLESYAAAAKTIQAEMATDTPSSPLAQVECFSWPDVCQKNNITAYPTIKMYRAGGKKVLDYKGPLSENAILKAYRLHSTAHPVVLTTCSECRDFRDGALPSWASSSLQAVVIGHFPKEASKEMMQYKAAAEILHGHQLMGICQEDCADAETGAEVSKPRVTVHKWADDHQPLVEYTGDYTPADLITFIQAATRPLVPELTPSTFPLYLARGKPFLILFKDVGDQSKEAEMSLASLARDKTFESELVILWMDVSQPSSAGSKILSEYGIRRQSLQPSIVFVDHGTSRVCNYPPDYSLKTPAMSDWIKIILNGEVTCSGLKDGKFEPLIRPYDFLAFIKESDRQKMTQRMSRLPSDHHPSAQEMEEEEEEFGEDEGRGHQYMPNARADEHHHTEL